MGWWMGWMTGFGSAYWWGKLVRLLRQRAIRADADPHRALAWLPVYLLPLLPWLMVFIGIPIHEYAHLLMHRALFSGAEGYVTIHWRAHWPPYLSPAEAAQYHITTLGVVNSIGAWFGEDGAAMLVSLAGPLMEGLVPLVGLLLVRRLLYW